MSPAEIGHVVHPDHPGNGFARNTASGRVLRKVGMRREAHFVQNELVKGEWCDEVVYAVLAREHFAGN